jgi:hypothetical protein
MSFVVEHRRPLIFAGLAILYPLVCILCGDLIPVNAGLGYDGARSAAFSQHVSKHLLNQVHGAYTFQKSLIWFLLGGIYWVIAQISPAFRSALAVNDMPEMVQYGMSANATIGIVSYWLVNSVCLATSIFLWERILRRLSIRGPVALLSYFLLFINVANLKMVSFYITISDVPLLLVGMSAIYFYLAVRQRALMTLGIISGFVRSGLPELNALLLLFPYRGVAVREHRPGALSVGAVLSGFASIVLIASTLYWGVIKREVLVQDGLLGARWLAAPILCCYVAVGLFILVRPLALFDLIPKLGDLVRGAAVLATVAVLLKIFASPSDLEKFEFFHRSVLTGLIFPGLSLVAHVVYFGPAILLILLLWSRLSAVAQEFGTGFVAVLALGLFLSINSESRTLTQYLPAFTIALSIALARMPNLPRWGMIATAILCVAFSKVWLPMAGPTRLYDGQHYAFPEQLYFMNFGPWMSLQSYLWQTAAVLGAALILVAWLYGPRDVINTKALVQMLRARMARTRLGKR